jgi:hypothetical protein
MVLAKGQLNARLQDVDRTVRFMTEDLDGIENRALIAELLREGLFLGDVLSGYRKSLCPPATPLTPTTRRRIA